MSFAATLLMISAPLVGDVTVRPIARPIAKPRRQAPIASGRASVEIIKGERIVFERIDEKRSPRTTIRRDARGTVWVEYS